MALPLNEWLAIHPKKDDSEHTSPHPMRLAASLFRGHGESFPIVFIISEDNKPYTRYVVARLNVDYVDNGQRTTPHLELKGSVVALGSKKPERQLLFHAQAYDPYRRVGIIKLYEDPLVIKPDVDFPIEELDIGARAYNGLKRVGLHTVHDVAHKTAEELCYIPYVGIRTVQEIEEALSKVGLRLREETA